jgi:branched-chain amino acid transport system permease protein
MLSSVINGLINGAIYGLVAIGLVLVYKGARVFNFAQGEFGTVAVFVAWVLNTDPPGLPLWMAILAGLAAATAFGLLVELLVVRPLRNSPRVILLVATAGIAIGAISIQLLLGEAEARVLPPIISGQGVTVARIPVTPQQMLMIVMLAVVALLLYLFFTRTNLGLAVLATSQDPLATGLAGISTKRISALVWGMAALLGGVAGLLQGPVTVFFPGFMTATVLLPAFTGAVLGGMTSLPGAFVGGLLVGVAQDVGSQVIPETITGSAELTVFALLLLVLLVRPQGLLGKEA